MTLEVEVGLASLGDQALAEDDGHDFCRVRLDMDAFTMLRATPFSWGQRPELDLYGPNPNTWRHIPIIIEVPDLTATPSRHAKPDDVVIIADQVKIICIETRQRTEHGRSKYYNWERPK